LLYGMVRIFLAYSVSRLMTKLDHKYASTAILIGAEWRKEMKKKGIKNITKDEISQIINLHYQNISSNKIGSILNRHGSTIRDILKKNNISLLGYDRPIKEIFWKNIKEMAETNCWEWQGYIPKNSKYGRICSSKIQEVLVHRISYLMHKGKILNGLRVLHICDNRKCVNPDHLFLGNHQDNMEDRNKKERGNNQYNYKGDLK